VLPVLSALGEGYKTATITEVTEFLRALGAEITPLLLRSLDSLGNPAHRRLLCDMIIEFGVPEVSDLLETVQDTKWFVVRDVLTLAQQLPAESIGPLIAFAIRHEHPKVRAHAVGMLRGYGRGVADRYLAERIADDADLEVRLSAIRVAAARSSVEVKPLIEQMLSREDLSEREPREIRMLTAAFAKIAGTDAVPVLDKILNPGFFASLKSTEAQIAAAYALGAVGTESASMVLQKGARSLNSKVREAVKKALARGELSQDLLGETPESGTKAPTGDLTKARIPDAKTEPDGTKPLIPNAITDVDERAQKHAPDVEFYVPRKTDPLDKAPAFQPTLVEAKKPKTVDLHRSGPAAPHVVRPNIEPERIPDRIPNTYDLPPPERVPLFDPEPPRAPVPPPEPEPIVLLDPIPLELDPISNDLEPASMLEPVTLVPDAAPLELEPDPMAIEPLAPDFEPALEDVVFSFDASEEQTDEQEPKSPLTDDLTLE
jgi:hypothetical protein